MAGRADDKLHRLLVVGVGSIGERHVRCFQKSERANDSICELNARLRDEVGGRYEIERVYAEVEAALAEPYDAVVVAVPADVHVARRRANRALVSASRVRNRRIFEILVVGARPG